MVSLRALAVGQSSRHRRPFLRMGMDEMHIGLKGTMNALFLKDLAAKTRRGLRGRVEQGKSGGGNAYGYTVLRSLGEDGEVRRGDRGINTDEASVVRRIFRAYADGQSPNRIADLLNREGIPGPQNGKWDKSTIHGNPKRGTGVLNNEIYIGKLVWNRQSFVKDPRFLLTGLVKCGCGGGGFSTVGKDRFGCSNSRNKGRSVCTNRTGITRQELEGRILSERLMDKAFAAEYIAERNRLAAHHVDDRAVKHKELAKVIRDQDVLVNAILAGTPAERIKAKMKQLETRQKQLEKDLAAATAPTLAVRIHPKMAGTYHDRIRALIQGLTEPDQEGEAREAIRGLIDRIVAVPVPTKGKRHRLDLVLHGDLAGILALSLAADLLSGQQKTSCDEEVMQSAGFLVAGACGHRNLPELSCPV